MRRSLPDLANSDSRRIPKLCNMRALGFNYTSHNALRLTGLLSVKINNLVHSKVAASRSATASIPLPPLASRVGAEARRRGGRKGKAEGEGKWGSDKRREGRGEEEGRKGRRGGGRSHVDAPCNYLGRTWRRATQPLLLRHGRDALPCRETHEKQLSEGRKVTQGSLAPLPRTYAEKESLTNDVAATPRQSGPPNARRTWAQHRPATNHGGATHETAEPRREESLLLNDVLIKGHR